MGIDRTDIARLEKWHETIALVRHENAVRGAPDGIRALGLPHLLAMVLVDHGLDTIAKIQRRVADDSISDVPRIGKGREKALREALAAWGREHTAEKALEELVADEDDEDEGGES